MKKPDRKVQRREVNFAQKIKSEIWLETPSAENPFVAEKEACYGYDLINLINKRSFIDVLYLLFKGDLPDKDQSRLLEILMIGCINPGPRHPATRAAMTAGVGRTDIAHILPIGLNVLGGKKFGVGEVELAMKFLSQNAQADPVQLANQATSATPKPNEGDWFPCPGFGTHYGSIDPVAQKLADELLKVASGDNTLIWADRFSKTLNGVGAGWLKTGVAAATLNDLAFDPRSGSTFFQLINAPGLLAHGLELSRKSITALPFPADEDYIIEEADHEK